MALGSRWTLAVLAGLALLAFILAGFLINRLRGFRRQIARIKDDDVLIDMRTLLEGEDKVVVEAIERIVAQ